MTKLEQTLGDGEPWEKGDGKYPAHLPSSIRFEEGGTQPDGSRFDLEERTARFAEAIIRFVKRIPQNSVNNRIIDQLVGCGTSIGGNYCEADEAVSKKEFICKIGTCKKEAKETKFFLRIVATAEPSLKDEARELWREAKELHLIFSAIFRSGRKSDHQ